jgi:hypothetical protein
VAVGGKRERKLGLEWVGYQLRQIYADYNISIPMQKISIEEIRFFYMPMIPSLCRIQKASKDGK